MKYLPIYRVRSVSFVAVYTLHVTFDDGTAQTIDFAPVLAGALYGLLRDPALFRAVQVDPEVHTLVWPNGADFDPATSQDWSRYLPELSARARQWQQTAAG